VDASSSYPIANDTSPESRALQIRRRPPNKMGYAGSKQQVLGMRYVEESYKRPLLGGMEEISVSKGDQGASCHDQTSARSAFWFLIICGAIQKITFIS
jgi:hypothetical protein